MIPSLAPDLYRPAPPVVLVAAGPAWTDHRAVRRELLAAWRDLGQPVRYVTCTLNPAPVLAVVDEVVATEVGRLECGRLLAWPWRHASLVVAFGSVPGVVGRMVERARDAGVPVQQVRDEDVRRAA